MLGPEMERLLPFGGRLVVTVMTLIGVSVVASYVVPKTASLLSRGLSMTLERWGVHDVVVDLWDHAPPGVSYEALIYSAQAATVTFASLFVLSVWGLGDVIGEAVSTLSEAMPDIVPVVLTGITVAVMYSGSRYIGDWVGGIGDEGSYVEEHTKEILTRSLQLTLLLGGTLTILAFWGVEIQNFLLGAGVLSIIIGFAARETFTSVVSGFVLMFSRPFTVGDWIEVGDLEGQVTDVTIVNTRLRTVNAEHVIIPNDNVSGSEIINYSNEDKLCLAVDVGVAYGTDLDRATEVIEEAVSDVDLLSSGSAVEVFPERFDDSAIGLEVRFWIDRPHPRNRRRATAEVIDRIKTAFEREGIEIPFPQRDVAAEMAASKPRAENGPLAE
jgi:small-conductance mechanosensitive channel